MFIVLYMLFACFAVRAMENNGVDDEQHIEILKVNDGDVEIKQSLLEDFSVLREALKCPGSFKLESDTFYTSKNFGLLFEALQDPKKIAQIDHSTIKEIFNLAGNLGAPKKFRKNLALRAIELDQPIQIDLDLGIRTIDDAQISIMENDEKLILSVQNFRCLWGLEHLISNNITKIDLSGNKLKRVKIKSILDFFPNVTWLDLSHNKLDYLNIGTLPKDFILKASGNRLSQVKIKNLGEGSCVDLSGNNFSAIEKERIRLFTRKLSLLEHWSVLKRHFSVNELIFSLLAACIFMPISGGVGYGAGYSACHLISDPPIFLTYYTTFLGIFLSFFVYPLLIGGGYINCYRNNTVCPQSGVEHAMCSKYVRSLIYFDENAVDAW